MARDEKQRQKKLAKQKKKRESKKQALRQQPTGLVADLSGAARFPVLDCLAQSALESQGIGTLLVSRQLDLGQVAVGTFLVDRYCLGVKDAFGKVVGRGEYTEMVAGFSRNSRFEKLDLAGARRLVEDAVEFARDSGLSPHPDYFKALPILGDADGSAPERVFEMGKDGRPLFVNGPYDTPQRINRVLAALERTRGAGGYRTMLIGEIDSLAGGDEGEHVSEDD